MRDFDRERDELHINAMDMPQSVRDEVLASTSGIVESATISLQLSDTTGVVLHKHVVGFRAGVSAQSEGRFMQLILHQEFVSYLNTLAVIQTLWLSSSGMSKRARIVALCMRTALAKVQPMSDSYVSIMLDKATVMSNLDFVDLVARILMRVDERMDQDVH